MPTTPIGSGILSKSPSSGRPSRQPIVQQLPGRGQLSQMAQVLDQEPVQIAQQMQQQPDQFR